MFHPISKYQKVGWKNEAQPSFLTNMFKYFGNPTDETLFRVFDIF